MRCLFGGTRAGQPIQVVQPDMRVDLPVFDLTDQPPDDREAEAVRLAALEAAARFDLTSDPMLRAALVKLSAADHVMLVTMHHIASAGSTIVGCRSPQANGTRTRSEMTRRAGCSMSRRSALSCKMAVHALSIDDGSIRSGWPVDADTAVKFGTLAFSSLAQGERGGVALLNGQLLVPYGGLNGDCGDYHGWIASISTRDPTKVSAWATGDRGAGMWNPGGITSDGTSAFGVTGNAFSGTTWNGSDRYMSSSPPLPSMRA